VKDVVLLPRDAGALTIVEIDFTDGEPQRYLLPLAVAQARRAEEQESARSATLIARLRDGVLLYEPVVDESFALALLETIARRRQLKGGAGSVHGAPARAFRELRGSGDLHAQVLKT